MRPLDPANYSVRNECGAAIDARDIVEAAVMAEREACAQVAADPRFHNAPAMERPRLIAYWIRARGAK